MNFCVNAARMASQFGDSKLKSENYSLHSRGHTAATFAETTETLASEQRSALSVQPKANQVSCAFSRM